MTRMERLHLLRDVAWEHVVARRKGRLARFFRGVRRWDLNVWDEEPDEDEPQCATAACLLGSYALTKYGSLFFRYNRYKSTLETRERLNEPFSTDCSPATFAAEHFGITVDESRWLFLPGNYEQPSAWRAYQRVRKLISKYEAHPELLQ